MQLVELQRTVEGSAEEVAVADIAYDGVDVLSAVAVNHGITYPHLAEEGSPTIQRSVCPRSISTPWAHWSESASQMSS